MQRNDSYVTLLEQITGIDLAMGHPDCGNFSRLTTSVGGDRFAELNKNPGDILLFIDLIKKPFSPFTKIFPELGLSKPPIRFKSVVLPQPEGPTITAISPG